MNLQSDECKFYSEIYKTLLKIVKEDLNLWMYTCYALQFQCYKKIIPKLICKFMGIQNRIPEFWNSKILEFF